MAEIRPVTHADVPAVVALLRPHMEAWSLDERAVVGLMLDHPWADERLTSLVAVDGDEIIGFTGVQVRRLRLDGRPIVGVTSTNGVVAPDRRGGAVGALLLTRVLKGPQDFTWSDATTPAVARVFEMVGGHVDEARSCDWMLVLRPTRWLRGIVGASVRRKPAATRTFVPVGAVPAQAAGPRLLPRAFPEPVADVVGEDATAAAIVEHVPTLNRKRRVWVDHDEAELDHLFRLVETFRGPLVRRLVHRAGRPAGWYAYLLRRGGASRVLHLAALDADVDAVLGELVSHAHEQGSAVLTGRAEPHLQEALARRLAVLGYARRPVIRTKDPELDAVMGTSAALLTRLEGEVFAT